MSNLSWLRPFVWTATGVYTIALLIATHLPPTRLPKTPGSDLFWHFIAYAVLATLVLCSAAFIRPIRSAAPWVVLAILIFAAADELTQPLFRRFASWSDWFSDAAGAAVAVATILVVAALRRAI